jgi:SAM-dependent methyltransferase
VLDVGCGPGALTSVLVARVGSDRVAAVDPSEPFVAAVRARFPGVEARQATAEALPYDDGSFDAALAQLVVHFMADPVVGLAEMRRVTGAGGTVATCVWDFETGAGPLSEFWDAARSLDPSVRGEAHLAGARSGHLAELAEVAGWTGLESGVVHVSVPFAGFEHWWEPFTLGVGPAGDHVASLDDQSREALRERLRERFPAGPFEVDAAAWSVRGHA